MAASCRSASRHSSASAATPMRSRSSTWAISTVPALLSILLPTAFAALLGYFMFYGRISDAYVGVITLTVTVILFNVMNSTAGDVYHIGNAPAGRLQRHAVRPAIEHGPAIPRRRSSRQSSTTSAWDCCCWSMRCCALILASRFGRVVVAIRENETRAMLLGYDPRLYKLLAFAIGGGVAGLAGCVFVNWGGFIRRHRVRPVAIRADNHLRPARRPGNTARTDPRRRSRCNI